MNQVIKKLKLNELQKESLNSKEMRKLSGGVCGCVYFCTQGSNSENFVGGYITGSNSCGSGGSGGGGCSISSMG